MKKGLVTLVVAASAVGTLGGAARPGGAAAPASAVARCDGGRLARSDVHGLAVGAGIAGADGGAILRTSPAGTELLPGPPWPARARLPLMVLLLIASVEMGVFGGNENEFSIPLRITV